MQGTLLEKHYGHDALSEHACLRKNRRSFRVLVGLCVFPIDDSARVESLLVSWREELFAAISITKYGEASQQFLHQG